MTRPGFGFRAYLAVTGGATLLILAKPEIVLIGFLMLIAPGLLLSVMPVAFGYGSAFGLVRLGLHRWLDRRQLEWAPVPLNGAAVLITLALGCAVPALCRLEAHARLQRLTLDPVIPGLKIAVTGDVRLELPAYRSLRCGAECSALLRLASVRSVTVAALPADAAALRQGSIDPAATATTYGLRAPDCRDERAMAHREGEVRCLVVQPRPPRYDMLVRTGDWLEWDDGAHWSLWAMRRPVEIRLNEVRRDGRVLARAWQPQVRTPAIPLRAWPMCGSTWETKLCWANTHLGAVSRGDEPSLDDMLDVAF